ncbi:MAG: hypothetical protein II773_06580 [Oscillospiraceae bacterium]|nr:hypothetical protein [Oscillospiraceae bacterium]
MKENSLLKRFVKEKKVSDAEKMILCVIVSLSAMFYWHENHIPHAGIIRLFLTGVMAAMWIWCAVISGRDKKASFPVFMCIYWMIPYAFAFYYPHRDNVRHYSKALSFVNRISKDIAFSPFSELSARTGVSITVLITVFLFCVVCCYILGYFIRYRYDKAFPAKKTGTAEKDPGTRKGTRFRED